MYRLRTFLASLSIAVTASSFAGGTAYADDPVDPANLPSLTTCPQMGPGDHSDCVQALQYSFRVLGINMTQDGIYGDQTEAAVRAFQTSHGLANSGLAEPATIAEIDQEANSPTVLSAQANGIVGPAQPNSEASILAHGVLNCGIVTCTYYVDRPTTHTISEGLNDNTNQGAGGALDLIFCAYIDGGVPCDAALLIGEYAVTQTTGEAADQNACFEYKWYEFGVSDGSFVPIPNGSPAGIGISNGNNCLR